MNFGVYLSWTEPIMSEYVGKYTLSNICCYQYRKTNSRQLKNGR
jgi:hypothetical protein